MKQGVFAVMCTISAPLIIFEYIWLIWNWSGGGMFRLITTPVVLLLSLLGLVVITKKMRNRRLKKRTWRAWILLMVLLLPILTVATVQGIACMLGLNVTIA